MGTRETHNFKKSLGQHFLRDHKTILEISNLVRPENEDLILEIGAGDGALTEPFSQSGARIIAVEIDKKLANALTLRFDKTDSVNIINQDILHFDFLELGKTKKKWKIVGNLPYNISTQLILKILNHANLFSLMTVMVQKEVGDRLIAKPGSKAYGRLSVMAQRSASLTHCLDIAPENFFPIPKVWSSIIQIRPSVPLDDGNFESSFRNTVRTAFSHRRKTLANSLKNLLTPQEIRAAGIDPLIRAERLAVGDFEALAKVLENKKMETNS